MPTISEQTIETTLDANNGAAWMNAYLARGASLLAAAAKPWITLYPFQLASQWEQLDDSQFREHVLTAEPQMSANLANTLSDSSVFKQAVTAALQSVPLKPPSRGQLIKVLIPLITSRLTVHAVQAVARTFPLEMVWPDISHALASDLFQQFNLGISNEALLQSVLVTAFFQASRLPRARDVRGRLGELQRKVIDLRGGLLRLVQRLDKDGITEPPPAYVPYAAVHLDPRHRALSVIADSTETEAALIGANGGFMHRALPIGAPVDPGQPVPAGLTQQDVESARRAAWSQYEYSALTFTTIASTEFLIRSAAERRGFNGEPVLKLAQRIGLPQPLTDSLDRVFGSDEFSLRNKVMHGAFLEIESRRTEINMTLPFAAKIGLPTITLTGDGYLPETAAAVALKLLRDVDTWVATHQSLPGPVLTWPAAFALTAAEILRSRSWHQQTVHRWLVNQNALNQFLRAYFPALSVPVKSGLQGWVKPAHGPDLIPQFGFLAIMLEPLARLTYHFGGRQVLQTSITHARQNPELDLKYLMLDNRGFISPANIAWLKTHLDAADVSLVDDVFSVAVKARDAFAHGATTTFTDADREAYGTPVALAILILLSAAQHILPPA